METSLKCRSSDKMLRSISIVQLLSLKDFLFVAWDTAPVYVPRFFHVASDLLNRPEREVYYVRS